MIKKVLIPIAIVAVFIVAVGIFVEKASILTPFQSPQPTITPATITISGKNIPVEVVKTPQEREKGLSGRSSLNPDTGMLFKFESGDYAPSFWMKGMLIPLDIIWIKGGKVIRIDKNVPVPKPNTADEMLKTYSAGGSIDYVLEVNAGFSDSNSIKVGNPVTVSGI